MSGKPNRTPIDATNFRKAYLASLELQAKNDDVNLQANKIFKKTGQTPTQMTDFRTTEEKLADIERLKIDVRSELSKIADGQQADSIVQQLSNDELEFLAQHINEIITNIKPKYKYGILADVFIPYLQSYIEKAVSSNEVSGGNQQGQLTKDILINLETLMDYMFSQPKLDELIEDLKFENNYLSFGLQNALQRDIEELKKIMPTVDEIKSISRIQDAITKRTIQEELNYALRDLPTIQQVKLLLKQLEVAQSHRDTKYADEIGVKLHQLLSIDPATKEQMEEVKQLIQEAKTEQSTMTSASYAEAVPEAEAVKIPKGQLSLMSSKDPTFNQGESPVQSGKSRTEMINYINRVYPNVQAEYEEIAQKGKAKFFEEITGQKTALTKYSYPNLKKITTTLNKLLVDAGYAPPIGGVGIKGKGISKSIKSKTDYSKGIMPVDKYVPFGRFHIDSHKLNDDIVALKRHTGCNVSGLPVVRVSKDMGKVIRTIVGGGQPSFNHLEKLSQEEKAYLHKLAKHSNIIDRISVPSPNKDDDEKDINQFEIMKGEIMNGNDSNELVKKFKILIMKMMKKDLLPKGQAKDILIDLVSLGY